MKYDKFVSTGRNKFGLQQLLEGIYESWPELKHSSDQDYWYANEIVQYYNIQNTLLFSACNGGNL